MILKAFLLEFLILMHKHYFNLLQSGRVQLGQNLTRGLGAGGNPSIGQKAAEESRDELQQSLEGSDLVFIAAGMGGGTGTGAAPVVAEVAKQSGALTIGIVTKPFLSKERRMRQAEEGIARLAENVDTLIVIPNDRLKEVSAVLLFKKHSEMRMMF